MQKITIFALLVAAACEARPIDGEADAGPDAMITGTGIAEVGTGTLEFQPLPAADAELGLVAGPQGGFHFIVHARMKDMAPGQPDIAVSTPSTRFSAYLEDGTQIDVRNPAYRIAYEERPDGWYELPGGRILQIENEFEPGLYGQRVRIRVVIIDNEARFAEDDVWVTVFDHCARFPDDCAFGAPAP